MKYKTYKELKDMTCPESDAYFNIKKNMSVSEAKDRLYHLMYELQALSSTEVVMSQETCLQNALNDIGGVIQELKYL